MPGRERVDYVLSPRRPGDPIVLLAISGGGSRSAYYASRVMEELSKIPAPPVPARKGAPTYECSVLDSVRVISTVSAGGLAASYYVVNYDRRFEPDFYQQFRDTMAVNLQWRTYGHMALFPPLAVQLLASSVTRTDLLADEIEKLLGGGRITFDHLRVQETRSHDPAPVLLVNGTVYNSGQRLVMTNLPGHRFPTLLEPSAASIAISQTDARILHNLVQPLTFEDMGSDVGQFRLSHALAASAAYPMLLAPLALQVFPHHVPPSSSPRLNSKLLEGQVAYVADGGIYENEGVDSLLSLLKTMDRKQPVLLIVIDAAQRMETLALGEGKVWGPTSVISRISDIGALRPLAFYGSIASDFHDPSALEVVFIRMEGYDEESERALKNIPTSFKLSEKHRGALDAAAVANVQYMYNPLMQAYLRLQGRKPAAHASSRTAAKRPSKSSSKPKKEAASAAVR